MYSEGGKKRQNLERVNCHLIYNLLFSICVCGSETHILENSNTLTYIKGQTFLINLDVKIMLDILTKILKITLKTIITCLLIT